MDALKIIEILINLLRLALEILFDICQSVYYNCVGSREKNVTGEIVLITGAGHGIGKELAIQYACLDAKVVCLDVNKQTNEETAKEIKIMGKNAYTYQCDVTKREDVFAVAKKVKEEIGNVTILVNNAGIMPCRTLFDYTPDEITRMFNVNVLAHFWTLQAFLPSMIERNYGHVVALSSISGIVGLPNLIPYSATKHAVQGLMDALENELRLNSKKKSLINFTTLYPYMVDTGLCKKPKINKMLETFLLPSSTKDAAAQIIRAQRQNIRRRSIPSFWLHLVTCSRILPENAQISITDFIDSGVEPC
ncbi:PREDICTED: short-chain dehydrogenase/reductase family 16C member 6-like [Vollenhovia emeryi]|uniref:short-chain dehydrogenase/reductase family 16C member 6-like n=1 Tax=Vollenhovia emeryi TaxID=411798 RepID=UPI0005F58EB5|nr:PREDICTED: short-chain dehydrogenase/reductase family 16C member 6-like [Vollenhovia emeryi]XP_011874886.1 PREDICTED: short-chain dehydrogenase/reductase family 16C member 6-like [Vollenhovia emeryi]